MLISLERYISLPSSVIASATISYRKTARLNRSLGSPSAGILLAGLATPIDPGGDPELVPVPALDPELEGVGKRALLPTGCLAFSTVNLRLSETRFLCSDERMCSLRRGFGLGMPDAAVEAFEAVETEARRDASFCC